MMMQFKKKLYNTFKRKLDTWKTTHKINKVKNKENNKWIETLKIELKLNTCLAIAHIIL